MTIAATGVGTSPELETVLASHPVPARRRPRVVWVALAIVALLVVAAGGVAWLLVNRPPVLTVAAEPDATGTVQPATGSTRPLSARPADVAPGSVISSTKGLIELRLGGSVVRLDTGASVTATSGQDIRLRSGRVWVNTVTGSTVTLRTAHATTTDSAGPLVADCSTSCSFQVLDRTQVIVPTGTAGFHLGPHAAVSVSDVGRAGTPSFTAPDLLRGDPWISRNRALDQQEHRSATLTGGAVLGSWGITVHRKDLAVAMDRQVTIHRSCTAVACVLRAVTRQQDHPGTTVFGTVTALDGRGDHYRIDYDLYSARCAYRGDPHIPDGTETMTDTLAIRGSGGAATISGVRTSRYTAGRGSACTAPSYTRPITSAVTGSREVEASVAAHQDLDRQQLLLNYVRDPAGTCTPGRSGPTADLDADLVCPYRASDSTDVRKPSTVEFVVYLTATGVENAYRTLVSNAGVIEASGSCTTGPCESGAPGGRILQAEGNGKVELVTYDLRSAHLLVIARGAPLPAMHAWWSKQGGKNGADYTTFPIPRVGV